MALPAAVANWSMPWKLPKTIRGNEPTKAPTSRRTSPGREALKRSSARTRPNPIWKSGSAATRTSGWPAPGRHFLTGRRASLAGGDALVHISDPPAIPCAFAADLGAGHHQTKMRRFDMLAAGFEAMIHGRRDAGLVAAETSLDAPGHLFVHCGRRLEPSPVFPVLKRRLTVLLRRDSK